MRCEHDADAICADCRSVDTRLWASVLPAPPPPEDDPEARLRDAMTRLQASADYRKGATDALRSIEQAFGGTVDGLPDRIDATLTRWAQVLGLPTLQDAADARKLRLVKR
jgi:hypothetical protein